jgi:hypothetical protein
MEKERQHYERINEVLKRLGNIHLENVKKGLRDNFQHYRLNVNLPDELYHYENACLHLKREDTLAGKALESLPKLLIAHNQKVDSAQGTITEQVKNEFASHRPTYDKPEGVFNNLHWDNILDSLFSVWQAHGGELVKSRDQAQLLDYFTRSYYWNYENGRLFLMREVSEASATGKSVWRGSEERKDSVIESIKAVLVDSIILESLSELENSKSELETSVNQIRKVAARISEAIIADDYAVKVECCPTFFKTIVLRLLPFLR